MCKINEKVKEIHEMRKKLGAWDGYPEQASPADGDAEFYRVKTLRNAYLAQKLDEITWSICDAMRARKKGGRFDVAAFKEWSTEGQKKLYHVKMETCEHHLTLALLLTLDLMGFYGFKHGYGHSAESVENMFRLCVKKASMEARSEIRSALDIDLSVITANLLRIAELDKIDIERHFDALCQYMKGVKNE